MQAFLAFRQTHPKSCVRLIMIHRLVATNTKTYLLAHLLVPKRLLRTISRRRPLSQ